MEKAKGARTGEEPAERYGFDVFVNRLPNHGRGPLPAHVRTFAALLSPETRLSAAAGRLRAALCLTFVYSPSLVEQLRAKGAAVAVVADCQQLNSTARLSQPEEGLLVLHPRRDFGREPAASFHPKLLLLRFEGFLRVVIGSGNLLEDDWLTYGNVFYVRDFAARPPMQAPRRSGFGEYLQAFVRAALGRHEAEVARALRLDLSRYALDEEAQLLGSLPGRSSALAPLAVGFFQGRRLLRQARPQRPFLLDSTLVYYVTSSLNALTEKLMFDFAGMLVGEAMPGWEELAREPERLQRAFQVLFPSRDYVAGSLQGASRADCLFLRRSVFDSCKFRRGVLRAFEGDLSVPGNNSVLPHFKVFLATHGGQLDDDTVVYFGSHNFTQAAWGKIERGGQTCLVSNYELGVLLPPRRGSAAEKLRLIAKLGIKFPPRPYSPHDEPFLIEDQN